MGLWFHYSHLLKGFHSHIAIIIKLFSTNISETWSRLKCKMINVLIYRRRTFCGVHLQSLSWTLLILSRLCLFSLSLYLSFCMYLWRLPAKSFYGPCWCLTDLPKSPGCSAVGLPGFLFQPSDNGKISDSGNVITLNFLFNGQTTWFTLLGTRPEPNPEPRLLTITRPEVKKCYSSQPGYQTVVTSGKVHKSRNAPFMMLTFWYML